MIIEKATLQDIPQIMNLYTGLYDFHCTLEKAQERYRSILGNKNYTLLVAREDGQILGTALVIVCTGIPEDFLVIEDVIVNEEIRGKGIGKAIFAQIDTMAEEMQCNYAILISSGFRKGAHQFYEKMGYVDDVRGFRKVYIE